MDQARDLLERYGGALSAGDVKEAAACWTLPGLFLSDEGAILLTESSQIEQLFAQATQAYHAQGLVSTRSELKNMENLSEMPPAQRSKASVRTISCSRRPATAPESGLP